MLETPSQLATRFESGQIERAEFQALMALHARELIAEIEDDHQNPLGAWVEARLAKSAVRRLLRKHRPSLIREILIALADSAPSTLAKYLWNASHPDVPLHCFFRIRKRPVFRLVSILEQGKAVQVTMEFPASKSRIQVTLSRDRDWRLSAPPFSIG